MALDRIQSYQAHHFIPFVAMMLSILCSFSMSKTQFNVKVMLAHRYTINIFLNYTHELDRKRSHISIIWCYYFKQNKLQTMLVGQERECMVT